MNEINLSKYKSIINKNKSNESKTKKYIKNLITRIMIVTILFLSLFIICKKDSSLKEKIYNYLYTEDISFTKIKKTYNKYLGDVFPLKTDSNTEEVFNEKLTFTSSTKYYDGVNLEVSDNYLVPSLKEGMVVFIGEKDNYNKVIIIEDLEGIDTWYGNINSTSLKLYDYIEEGDYVGEVNKNLYLVFSKDDKYLDYEEYIS